MALSKDTENKNIKKTADDTLTTVISTPARCKIGAAFFSNKLLAFLEKYRKVKICICMYYYYFLPSYPLAAAGFKMTVAFFSCSCGAIN